MSDDAILVVFVIAGLVVLALIAAGFWLCDRWDERQAGRSVDAIQATFVAPPAWDTQAPTTCRIHMCLKPAEPGELCAYHAAPQDPDLVRESEREADGRHRRIG